MAKPPRANCRRIPALRPFLSRTTICASGRISIRSKRRFSSVLGMVGICLIIASYEPALWDLLAKGAYGVNIHRNVFDASQGRFQVFWHGIILGKPLFCTVPVARGLDFQKFLGQ